MHAQHYYFTCQRSLDVPDQSGFCDKYPLINQFDIPNHPDE